MREMKLNQSITTENVECKMVPINGQMVILDRDVAELYGVETKRINEAVKNNPDKFPQGYVIDVSDDDSILLRSKLSTLEAQTGRGKYSKFRYKVFTERGLYMMVVDNNRTF